MFKIAIVEDEPEVQILYTEALTALGNQVLFVANDGVEALEKLRSAKIKPDAIIMDYRMPVKDGVETTREIKKEFPAIKILMVSAYDEAEQDALNAGAEEFMRKPVSTGALGKALKKYYDDFGEKKSRGRPGLPEDDRKGRVTFSLTKRVIDRLHEHCEQYEEDTNRLMEHIIDEYLIGQGSIKVKQELIAEMDVKIADLTNRRETLEREVERQSESEGELNRRRSQPEYKNEVGAAALYLKLKSPSQDIKTEDIGNHTIEIADKYRLPQKYVEEDLRSIIRTIDNDNVKHLIKDITTKGR